jgi:pilus assembly protein CpaE
MTLQPQIIVIGNDAALAEELHAAAASLRAYRPVLRFVNDPRQAVEAARSWRPQLALVDIGTDLSLLKDLAREIRASVPEAAVVGVYRPDLLADELRDHTKLIEAYRAGVQDFLRRPISSADLSSVMDRLSAPLTSRAAALGKIVSFIGNKGGVGKSTVAVNVACGLARRHPESVLLIDASLQLGACASLLNLRPSTTLTDVARQRDRLDETLIRQLAVPHRSGLHVLAAPSTAVEGVEITDEVLSRLLTLARRCYKFVVIDTFPVFDRMVLAAIDLSEAVYVVFDNAVLTVSGVPRIVDLLRGFGVPPERQHLVLSRYLRTYGSPTSTEVARRLGRTVDHVVPYDRRMIAAANFGEPLILTAGRFNAARRGLMRIVDEIADSSPAIELSEDSMPSQNGATHKHAPEPRPL